MPKLRVIGFDPSMSNWGIAAGTYDTDTKQLSLKTIEVIQTSKGQNKQVRTNSDDMDRSQQIVRELQKYIDAKPHAVFVEVPVGSQSAAAMKSYGVCVGILGALRAQGVPIYPLAPDVLKQHATGSKTASKADMINWAVTRYSQLDWPTLRGKVIASKAEHMADAVAAVETGLKDPSFLQIAAVLQA